jgi:hypothetical protein
MLLTRFQQVHTYMPHNYMTCLVLTQHHHLDRHWLFRFCMCLAKILMHLAWTKQSMKWWKLTLWHINKTLKTWYVYICNLMGADDTGDGAKRALSHMWCSFVACRCAVCEGCWQLVNKFVCSPNIPHGMQKLGHFIYVNKDSTSFMSWL